MRASLAARALALVALVSVVAAGSAGDGAQLDPAALYASAVASGMSGPSTGPPARVAPLPSSFTSPALPSPDPRGGASFTCVTDRDRGTCFVATACELAGATRLGAKHVTLTADVTRTPTRETDAYRAVPDDDCDAFPIVVTSPMTVVGACGGAGGETTTRGASSTAAGTRRVHPKTSDRLAAQTELDRSSRSDPAGA